jgi:hypothetical protein
MKNDEWRAWAKLTVDVLATTEVARQRRSGRSDSDGRLQTGRLRGQDEARRSGSDSGQNGAALSGHRRAVPTALLMCWSSAARGIHVATARRLTGGTHSSAFFELKITPDENSSK